MLVLLLLEQFSSVITTASMKLAPLSEEFYLVKTFSNRNCLTSLKKFSNEVSNAILIRA